MATSNAVKGCAIFLAYTCIINIINSEKAKGNSSLNASVSSEMKKGLLHLRNLTFEEHSELNHIDQLRTQSDNYTAKCPPGLNFLNFYGMSFCYVLTEKQKFPPLCPYENYLAYEQIFPIYKKYQNLPLWTRIKRNCTSGFGQFEDLTPSHNYLEVAKSYERAPDNIKEKNCMIRHKEKLTPVKCDELYPILCIYRYDSTSITRYCSRRKQKLCISTSFNLDNKCYCRHDSSEMKLSRKQFCEKLVEPRQQFQSTMIVTQLKSDSPCWFGVTKNQMGVFEWESSQTPLEYFHWIPNTDLTKPFGMLTFGMFQGWSLENDEHALTCGVCEIEVDYQKVVVHLKYNRNISELIVRVENVVDIHNYFFHYVLSCFTDANTDDLTEKIAISIMDSDVIDPKLYTIFIKIKNNYPSYYWCETLQRPGLLRVFSNKLLINNSNGQHNHEYSLTVTVSVPKNADPYLEKLHTISAYYILGKLKPTNIINIVRPIKILLFNERDLNIHLLLHLSTLTIIANETEEYYLLYDILEKILEEPNSFILKINSFLRSDVCLPTTSMSNFNTTLNWRETPIGSSTIPKELCLQQNYVPLIRKCTGSFLMGGQWCDVQEDCAIVSLSSKTQTLYRLVNDDRISSDEIIQTLVTVTSTKSDIRAYDIHLISIVIQKILKLGDPLDPVILNIFSNIMDFENVVLNEAQVLLNSTDQLLHSLDIIMGNFKMESNTAVSKYFASNLLVHISDVKNITFTAVAFVRSFGGFDVVELNDTNDDSWIENLEVAIILHPEYIIRLLNCAPEHSGPIKLVTSVHLTEKLFNEVTDGGYISNSHILGVFVSNSNCQIESSLSIIFKPANGQMDNECGSWKYGKTEIEENIFGHWLIDTLTNATRNSSYIICDFKHTTHFTLLMVNDLNKNQINSRLVFSLNIITAIGCFLSFFGIGTIFVIAIFNRNWRTGSQNIIMLNFAVAVAAQMVLLFIADNARNNNTMCIVSGAFLHYTVLSEFAWMLIIAVIQYRKFVIVFHSRELYVVPKCIVIGWCFPLILVAIFMTIYKKVYNSNIFGFCYPTHEYFFIGVALPVMIIVIVNSVIFVRIFVSMCNKKVKAYGPKSSEIKLQVLLAVLLFFLLGMTWIFGLCAAFGMHVLFSYLFCLTATVQGLMLFMWFVIFNKSIKLLWLTLKKICSCRKV